MLQLKKNLTTHIIIIVCDEQQYRAAFDVHCVVRLAFCLLFALKKKKTLFRSHAVNTEQPGTTA